MLKVFIINLINNNTLLYIPNNLTSTSCILYFPVISSALNSTKVLARVSSFCLKSVVKI